MKRIQLFTRLPEKYDDNLEVEGELIFYKLKDSCLILKTKETDGCVWQHIFPLWNVSMVRISGD